MTNLTEIAAQRLAEIDATSPCPTRRMLEEIQAIEAKVPLPSAAESQVERLESSLPKEAL